MKLRSLHLLIALALLTASGIVHGKFTNRWVETSEMEGKNLLEGLDAQVGDWRTGEFTQVDPAELPAKTKCHTRCFEPAKMGKWIQISITSGGPGAVAVHTPDVCYLGAGWKLRGSVSRQSISCADGASAECWVADFTKTSSTSAETIRVRWSWTADGTWQAPDYPRWTLARSPILYKLYMVHPLTEEDDLTRDDPYRKFVGDLIPAVNRQLR